MSCTPQDVTTNASPFIGQPDRYLMAMEVYLLGQWAKSLNPALNVTPQALLDASACFRECMGGKALAAAAVYLLCQIESGGGGGGTGTDYIVEYANQAALPPAPADVNKVWIARFRDGSAGMTWSVVLQAWF